MTPGLVGHVREDGFASFGEVLDCARPQCFVVHVELSTLGLFLCKSGRDGLSVLHIKDVDTRFYTTGDRRPPITLIP